LGPHATGSENSDPRLSLMFYEERVEFVPLLIGRDAF
jgi:hypothetical protein